MAAQPDVAIQAPARETMPGWARLGMGGALCLAIAVAAGLRRCRCPLRPAHHFSRSPSAWFSLNGLETSASLDIPCGIGEGQQATPEGRHDFSSGGSLDLDIVRMGMDSLPLAVITVTAGLALLPLVGGRAHGIDWRIRRPHRYRHNDCGASAIAALAPCHPRPGGGNRLRHHRRLLLQHDRRLHLPGIWPCLRH